MRGKRIDIGTFTGQFTAREQATGSGNSPLPSLSFSYIHLLTNILLSNVYKEKKPLNPFLGEQFLGSWIGGTTLAAEQVSHHPPITAYLVENLSKRVSFQGHCAQKVSLSLLLLSFYIREA